MAEKRKLPRETLEKLAMSFNLLVSFGLLNGRYKETMQKKIINMMKEGGIKAQANKNSIEVITHY